MDEHKVKARQHMDRENKERVNLTLKPSDKEYLESVAREYNLTSISAAIAYVVQAFRAAADTRARYDKIRMK